ncbi:glycosyltransferase [Aurantiacibacter luteus]|uniref:Glycosyl transferase family 1 n=1 Tax=Aurantiacibacter luteus TaxID=1581420 RepID=A0A0G9MYS1_9SPHN|nr:glycosyltransferase [Aurantiacibacter luteus]KLE35932.1 hypothetical protein AAW00_06150 [Aurantiacibacter luteus]
MKIAVLAHIRYPVAPPFMGGMEAHCSALCAGLVARGHTVTLFAAPGSATAARLVPISPVPYEERLPWHQWRGTAELNVFQADAFAAAWSAIGAGSFDVVHNNALYPQLLAWAERDGVPMLTSQHVPPFAAMHEAVRRAAGNPLLQVSVTSTSQLALWADPPPANLSCVYNGIDTAAWQPADRTGPLLWSGRITPNKGTAQAVAAARQADVALDLVGTIEDAAYYANEIEPLLDERRCYLGHCSGADLRERVSRARALVMTPMWDEPFGLVAAEALSCDVPVIAFDNGAMREVVGDCGTIVPAGDVGGLAAAMRQPPALPAGQARARAERMFSIAAMIDGYERLYGVATAAAAKRRAAA